MKSSVRKDTMRRRYEPHVAAVNRPVEETHSNPGSGSFARHSAAFLLFAPGVAYVYVLSRCSNGPAVESGEDIWEMSE